MSRRLGAIHLDGFADVRLDGVGNFISGVYDQLVYSPAVAYTDVARNVKAIDPNFEAFANDLMSYYIDDDYFTDRQTQVYVQGEWEEELDCELEWRGIFGWEWICDIEYVWEPGGWITGYSGVTNAAASIWEESVAAEAGQGSWDGVVATLASQLGVDIQIGTWCVRVGSGGITGQCDSAGMSYSVLSLFLLLKHSKSPKGRVQDTIYLTGRKVLWFGPLHTALEYTRSFAGVPLTSITSAAPSVPFSTFGYLNNGLNRSEDIGNPTVTTVTSPSHPLALYHWDAIFEGHLKYKDDCIPYEASRPWVGSPPFPNGEFNSNSYIAGLLELTNSFLATGSMSDFWRGDNPVPNVYYTSSTPCP